MRRPRLRSARPVGTALVLLLVAGLAPELHGESYMWVDERGVTHFSNDPDAVPDAEPGAAIPDVDRLRALWGSDRVGPVPATPRGSSSSPQDRAIRLVVGAVADLERGEVARATAALRSAARIDPRRPEPYWYLAGIDRQRGRYESAAGRLRDFLSVAGPELEAWRASARRRLASLEDERRLADESIARGPLELVAAESDHFRVQLDSELSKVSADYATTVIGYLEDARGEVSARVGVEPLEPLGVVFYGRAAYSKTYRHRFSFQTVGFFDGRIHVSSPAHPSSQLRSLLYHEYTHAVFRDRTGGDRPYWLNEGLAEQMERRARNEPASTRSERASLRSRIVAGEWIPLRRLAPSFSGLSNDEARAAYLESVVAAAWIGAHSDRAGRARLLARLGDGVSVDQALYELLGLDTDGVDRAVQEQILSEFPAVAQPEPQPASLPSSS